MDIALYTCYHEPYHQLPSDILVPLHVGSALAQRQLPMQRDSEGENISARNPHFCELTGTYWIWKNATADIVGLFHYRRYLNLRNLHRKAFMPDADFLNKHGITRERLEEIFSRYDVLLPCPNVIPGTCIYELYGRDHPIADLDTTLAVIREKYPDMAELAAEVLHRRHRSPGYLANIIACRKPLFDEYAAWLFDVLFEVERRIHADVLTRDVYQQRVYGFLSERLMNVFIEHRQRTAGWRVCEMPTLRLTEDAGEWRHYITKHIKHRLLIALGLGKEQWEENVKPTTI